MNYYEILQVPKNATQEQIKDSYKKLVKKYHPDLYLGDKSFAEEKIKKINEAYEVLSDPQKKLEYDNYLNPPEQPTRPTYQSQTSYQTRTTNTSYPPPQSQSTPQWSFSNFIIKKFNKLNKKTQLQIFLLVLISMLALFLINLIQMHNYLNSAANNDSYNYSSNNDASNTTIEIPDNSTESDEYNDFETLDDYLYQYFYELFENTEPDFSNDIPHEYKK